MTKKQLKLFCLNIIDFIEENSFKSGDGWLIDPVPLGYELQRLYRQATNKELWYKER